MVIRTNRVLTFLPRNEREEFALALASYTTYLNPEVDPDELKEYILAILDDNDGELTIVEWHQLAEVAIKSCFDPDTDILQ